MRLYCKNTGVEHAEGRDESVAMRLVKTTNGYVCHRTSVLTNIDYSTIVNVASYIPPHTIIIPKVIVAAESLRVCSSRLEDSFCFQSTEPPSLKRYWGTYNSNLAHERADPQFLIPSYWDWSTLSSSTKSNERFTRLIYIYLTSANTSLPVLVRVSVLCGIWLKPPIESRDGWLEVSHSLQPWVALGAVTSGGEIDLIDNGILELGDLFHRKLVFHNPCFLSQTG
jgi:hypothetical protein